MYIDPTRCKKCAGMGKVYNDFQMWFEDCPQCGGSGQAPTGPGSVCGPCLGHGTIGTARGVERCLACGGTGKSRF